MRNVLVFSVDYFPYVGGAEVAIRETCKRIPDTLFTLITCRNSRSLPRHETIDGVAVFRVGIGWRRIDKYLMPFTAFFAALGLGRQRRFSAAWAVMANTGAIAAFAFARIHGVRYILTLQEGDSDSYYRRRTWFWVPLYRMLHSHADHIHAISRHLERRARQFGYRGPVSVIPNGIDPALFNTEPLPPQALARVRSGIGATAGERVMVTASRLERKNGVDIFIRALAIMRRDMPIPMRAAIAGSGSEERHLKALAARLGVAPFVVFCGHLGHAELVPLLKAADVFARPSRSEGLGNVFLEAMACGVPVVGTPVGGIPDFLVDGATGLSCEPENPLSLARAATRIVSDARLRGSLVAGGLSAVRGGYGWDSIAPKVSALFGGDYDSARFRFNATKGRMATSRANGTKGTR